MTAKTTNKRVWFGGKREAIQDLYFREALDPNQWQAGTSDHWHSCWYTGMPKPAVFEQLDAGKTINHIPGNNSLTVKSNLHATLATAYQRLIAQEGPASQRAQRLRFFPAIHSMPHDYHALQAAAHAEPDKRWILKPKNGARGKDIRVVGNVAAVPTGERWMVQEYLDRPHTMFGRKYVLRLYVLITSVEPLRVYLYHEGSAKLASAAYDPDNIDNLYAHLTNPDVNATNEANTSPVVFVNLGQYREWLREQGHDDDVLFAQLRELVTLTVISAREKMRQRLQKVSADTSGCYELIGLDCLVDADLNPWLLECNLSPSLETCAAPEDGGETEARNKREMIEDLVRLLGLNERKPDRSQQPVAERVVAEAEWERQRAGGWTRVFPAEDAEQFLPFLPLPRLADMVLAEHAMGQRLERPRVRPHATVEIISDNQLSLYDEDSGTLYTPNPSAAWIWLQAADGHDPDRIAAELAAARGQASGEPDWATRNEVWEVLADWATSGLLVQDTGGTSAGEAKPDTQAATEIAPERERVLAGGALIDIEVPDNGLAERLREAFAPLRHPENTTSEPVRLQALSMTGGYALAREQQLVATGLPLAAVIPELARLIRGEAAAAGDGSVLPGALVTSGPSEAVWVIPEASGDQSLAIQLAGWLDGRYAGGVTIDAQGAGAALGLPLPCSAADIATVSRFVHRWGDNQRGSLVASTGDADASGYTVTAVVVAESGDTVSSEPRPLSVHDLLPALLPGLITSGAAAPDGDSVAALAQWLEQRPLWAVANGSENAVKALTEQLASTAETSGEPFPRARD
jgi:tubulin polyglutamylase TTLL5